MPKSHEEIKNIIKTTKDENETRIKLYKWGMDRGYCISDNPAKERFLSNVLSEPLDEILKNPNILWGRDSCKDDFITKIEMPRENPREGNEFCKHLVSKIVEKQIREVLSFDQWRNKYDHSKDVSFYDVCAYVSSVFGSDVFNVFLQNAKRKDNPKFTVVENPGFISKHTEQFVSENEWRISKGEKRIFLLLKKLCKEIGLDFPDIPVKDFANELWTPIESDDVGICGWLCIDKNTKKCYIIKIS